MVTIRGQLFTRCDPWRRFQFACGTTAKTIGFQEQVPGRQFSAHQWFDELSKTRAALAEGDDSSYAASLIG